MTNRQLVKLLAAIFFVISAIASYEIFGAPKQDTKEVHDMDCTFYRGSTRSACVPK